MHGGNCQKSKIFVVEIKERALTIKKDLFWCHFIFFQKIYSFSIISKIKFLEEKGFSKIGKDGTRNWMHFLIAEKMEVSLIWKILLLEITLLLELKNKALDLVNGGIKGKRLHCRRIGSDLGANSNVGIVLTPIAV